MKKYKFNKWEYEIIKNQGEGLKGYGYEVTIYKNNIKLDTSGAFINESMAESYLKNFIIENEHNIELNNVNDY